MYVTAFADSADAKNLLKTKAYQQKSADEQAAVYLEKLYSYAYSIEREKLFYFSLVYQQTTVIITAPADNKAQKEFLDTTGQTARVMRAFRSSRQAERCMMMRIE